MDSHSVFQSLEEGHGSGLYKHRGITLVRGHGVTVWDDKGKTYLDCTAGYGVACLGHAHPDLVKAISDQSAALWSCSGSFGSDQRALLLQELGAVLPGFERFFFCNSGTESIEAAIKFARLTTRRAGVVAAARGFHGRTLGALSATSDETYREPFAPLVPGFEHVPYDDADALEQAIGNETAAVILEVIQGEGGVHPAGQAYLKRAQELCNDRGALFIVDEVQTGFGRTGHLFAFQHAELEPDLLCLGKGMAGGFPMGAVAMGPRVARLPVGAHGTTFGGNPLACAVARATLRTLVQANVPARALDCGEHLLRTLRAIANTKVKDIRGRGLMVGVEFDEPVAPYIAALQANGVLVLNAGPKVIRFLPPLTITKPVLDDVTTRFARIIESTGT